MSAILTEDEQNRITQAISLAENKTSGEIRLVIERRIGKAESGLERALFYFEKLKMHNTRQRNAVLIYVALEDKQLSILGDSGIHQKVGESFWDSTKEMIINNFKNSKIVEGLIEGINQVGEKLKLFFPYHQNDINELPDEIYFGESK